MILNLDILSDQANSQVYVVGGTIRDILLGRHPLDIDVAVAADPGAYAQRLAEKVSGRLVVLGRSGQLLYRVVTADRIYDVTALQGNTINEDLRHRDYTINAMAYDIYANELIDVTHGQQDLSKRTIRMVSEKSLRDDPLRLIRAYRIAAELAFNIDPATLRAIKHNAARITQSAGERVRDELFKILATAKSSDQLRGMAASGLLEYIFPELAPMKKLLLARKSGSTVFEHSLEAFSILEHCFQDPLPALATAVRAVKSRRQARYPILLKISILLHQIGRAAPLPLCASQSGYARRGADQVDSIAARLRFSKRDTAYLAFVIRNHRKPFFLHKADRRKPGGNRLALIRYCLHYAPYVPDLALQALAARQAAFGVADPGYRAFESFAHRALSDYHRRIAPRLNQHPLINGKELIDRFGLTPSPQIKVVLRRIEEMRLMGILHRRVEAENWVEEFLESYAHSTHGLQNSRRKT